jgi:hypothetical protein
MLSSKDFFGKHLKNQDVSHFSPMDVFRKNHAMMSTTEVKAAAMRSLRSFPSLCFSLPFTLFDCKITHKILLKYD